MCTFVAPSIFILYRLYCTFYILRNFLKIINLKFRKIMFIFILIIIKFQLYSKTSNSFFKTTIRNLLVLLYLSPGTKERQRLNLTSYYSNISLFINNEIFRPGVSYPRGSPSPACGSRLWKLSITLTNGGNLPSV